MVVDCSDTSLVCILHNFHSEHCCLLCFLALVLDCDNSCKDIQQEYGCRHVYEALEKRVNKNYEGVNSEKLSFSIRNLLKTSLPYIFSSRFLAFFAFLSFSLLCIQFALFFPRFSEVSRMRVTFDRGVVAGPKHIHELGFPP